MTEPGRSRRALVLVGVCAAVVVASLALSAITFVRQSQADTVRAADRKSQDTTLVGQCFSQVKNAPGFVRILGIVDILATNSIKANQQALDASGPNDPLRKTRQDSLRRLEPARQDLRVFIKRTKAGTPTTKACNTLAANLGVDPTKLNQKEQP